MSYTSRNQDPYGNQKIIIENIGEDLTTIVTPNLCDKCTWYYEATEVEGETLTPDGSRITFSSVNTYWIDLTHGRLTDENDIAADFAVVVKVDGTTKTMDTPFVTPGDGDYYVDYENGDVIFHEAVGAGLDVTADYHYEDGSEWILQPASGYDGHIFSIEAQFSKNITINDTVYFKIYGYVQYFAPDLCPDPYPENTLIPIKVYTYKTLMDYINRSNGAYPVLPACGGSTRGVQNDIVSFPWKYKDANGMDITLCPSKGMEVRVGLENDNVFSGELATVTLYTVSSECNCTL
jgi:hypothetical protein